MEFIKTLIKNRKLAMQLGKNDFKNRFANTSLGTIWGFIQPFIFMMTYVIVFQYILRQPNLGTCPYVVWFLPGMSMWMFTNDAILNASNSIRTYSYLVKKVVFPVDIIPVISLSSSSFIGLFLLAIATVVSSIMGYLPNVFILVYIIFAAYCFIISFTRFTSALSTLVPDFSQLLGIVMQLCFWFTPIVWNLGMVGGKVLALIKFVPFTYLVEGMRQAFSPDATVITEKYGMYTIAFWIITLLIFLWGNYVFKKGKKDFADVL